MTGNFIRMHIKAYKFTTFHSRKFRSFRTKSQSLGVNKMKVENYSHFWSPFPEEIEKYCCNCFREICICDV